MTFWFKSYEARLLDLTEEDLQSCPFAQEVLRSFGAKPWPWPEKSARNGAFNREKKIYIYIYIGGYIYYIIYIG